VPRPYPVAGSHYPGSYGDVLALLPDDEVCLDYLDWLRWPDGFSALTATRWSGGGSQMGVGRVPDVLGASLRDGRDDLHGPRNPLTVFFAAAWHMTSDTQGVSALGLQRVLEVGSYQTAWAMLHRYRSAMVRPGRDRLSGTVEADDTFLGGPEPGVPGVARSERSWSRSLSRAWPRLRTLSDTGHRRRERWDAAGVPPRARRTGLGDTHRRLPELPVCLQEGLRPPSDADLRLRPPGSRAAPRRSSRRLPRQTLARSHPPGSCEAWLVSTRVSPTETIRAEIDDLFAPTDEARQLGDTLERWPASAPASAVDRAGSRDRRVSGSEPLRAPVGGRWRPSGTPKRPLRPHGPDHSRAGRAQAPEAARHIRGVRVAPARQGRG